MNPPGAESEQIRRHLKLAVVRGDAEAVGTLLAAGGDPDASDGNGATLLIHAAARGHTEVCRLLLEARADPFCLDCFGKDASTYARRSGYDSALNIIEGHGSSADALQARAEPLGAPNCARSNGTGSSDEAPSGPDSHDRGERWQDVPDVPDEDPEQRVDEIRRRPLEIMPRTESTDEHLAAIVDDALATLPPLEAQVLCLRFGLEGQAELSREVVARRYGLTEEQVLEIEASALRKLRHPRLLGYLADEE